MKREGGNILLDNIDKAFVGVVLLVCLWLLIFKVLVSPVQIELENRKFGVVEVDRHVLREAEQLESRLKQAPEPKGPWQGQIKQKFTALLDKPVKVNGPMGMPLPYRVRADASDQPKYAVPEVVPLTDAEAEHIRAVAYLPTAEISARVPYSESETEPNDLDLVTVQAQFSPKSLYENFFEDYAGDTLKPEWRDPCLARPIFAALELQRQELGDDGQWSDWDTVPRTRIDDRRNLLKVVEQVSDLPRGGMKVRLLQYDKPEVTKSVLQPEAYQIASAEEQWFPPELHRKFVRLLREQKLAERRQELERLREERDRERQAARSGRSTRRTRPTISDRGAAGEVETPGGVPGLGPTRPRTSTRRDRINRSERRRNARERSERGRPQDSRREKETVDDVYRQLEEWRIADQTGLAALDELHVWAHDDTVKPGRKYRYRMRLGVFNPLAGTSEFAAGSEMFSDQVILWSDYAQTSEIEIPAKLYFFPTDIQQSGDISKVEVEVARYALGYWYMNGFKVKQGERIGQLTETPLSKGEEIAADILIPEKVDFDTGAVMLDAVAVDDWIGGRSLQPRQYFNLYYSYDGATIEQMPVEQRFWASGMQSRYNQIRGAMKEPKQPLRPWGGRRVGPQPRFRPGEMMLPPMEEDFISPE